ncbi:unnamed protein product [Clonostachys solani]|uniref:Major facilitator superfamily (MFS) profile domain-containing protein n=1 Tax=Clonostachys solani TaxID=160281 RepID=A0A9P0EL73_9HYPO|nr:unnamed protein product [Clonostachys solani]
MDKIDAKSAVEHKVSSSGHMEHMESNACYVMDQEPYGPAGFRGIFANRYVALCASFSAIGGLLFGYDQGVISVTLVMDHFLQRFPEVSDDYPGGGLKKGIMTAMIPLGAFVGAANGGWVADVYSRKYSIMIAVVVFLVGSALQTAAVDYVMLTVARLIGGLGVGMLSMVVPIYISEISPPEIRGSLLVFEELSIVLGIVVAFWITYATRYIDSNWSWQLPFLLQMVPGVFLGLGAILLPFSPRWLASKGRDDEALSMLVKLRQRESDDFRVRREWLEIISESKFQRQVLAERHPKLVLPGLLNTVRLEIVSWADCFRRGCLKRTHVAVVVMFFQQFVGINALIYYSPTLFGTMGLNLDMQLIMSGVLNVTQLIGVLSSLYTMDRFGRRPLLLAGSACMFIAHLVIAVMVGKSNQSWPSHETEAWVSVAFLLFYMLAFGASWGPVPWALPSEVFPSSMRAKGGLITPPLVHNTGYGAYVFFAVFCILSSVWTFFCVPETKGKSLEEMDEVFGDRKSAQDVAVKEEIFAGLLREKGFAQAA